MYQKKRDKCEGKRKDWGKKRKEKSLIAVILKEDRVRGIQKKREISDKKSERKKQGKKTGEEKRERITERKKKRERKRDGQGERKKKQKKITVISERDYLPYFYSNERKREID